eukprot:6015373-Amphidinium_carterae.2
MSHVEVSGAESNASLSAFAEAILLMFCTEHLRTQSSIAVEWEGLLSYPLVYKVSSLKVKALEEEQSSSQEASHHVF